MFDSNGPASNYIDQMSGSDSILYATLSDRVWTSPNPESHWGYDSDDERDVSVDSLIEAACLDLLSGMDLSNAILDGVNLSDKVLTGTILAGADLSNANLSNVNLSTKDLTGTIVAGADLSNANLAGKDLAGMDLTGTILTGADLSNAKLYANNLTNILLELY